MRERLVVIDDDPAMRLLLAETLSLRGHVVDAYGSGPEAIEGASWPVVRTAVVDWMMPGMSGVEVVTWLAEAHPDVQRVIVTAASEALLAAHPGVQDLAVVLAKTELTLTSLDDLIRAG